MNTVAILIKTDPKIKEKAQKTAEEMGISLTSVINHYLKYFIQAKSITFTAGVEAPNQYMTDALKQSEEEYAAGKSITFASKKGAHSYLDTLIEDAKRN
jgi:addiction module RelB/DinJ family antitoxin